ncbi:MAG: tetratricopeptide repeat protein, partial [Bryobacteraceae bacterium]
DVLSEVSKLRFRNEAQAAARVHHPNICPIYEIDEVDGRLFFAMAHLEGNTISELLAAGPLDVRLALELAIQIANGLEEAHRHGVVHRDIKSSNVLVSRRGHACILDFGLALQDGFTRLTQEGRRCGTPAYMSPEQANGTDVDPRTDIWSLGVVLYEMITGRPPFGNGHDVALLHRILNVKTPTLASLRADVPVELQAVIDTALAKQPADRWPSALRMAAALQSILDQSPARIATSHEEASTQTLGPAPAPPESTPAPRLLKRKQALAAGLVFAAAASVAGFFRLREAPASRDVVPAEKNIAVLPFEVIGGDESTRAISDGVMETLTAKLTQLEQFQGKFVVVPSSEVRTGKITSVAEARRAYGVNLVITGGAQKWGSKIQFSINLVDAAKLRQIGSRTFDYDAVDAIALRDGAVRQVVSLLEVELTPAAQRTVTQGETGAPGAYSEYLQGRGHLARYDIAGNIDRAITNFSSAVQQDPNYALAFAGLGEAYWWKARQTSDKHWAKRAVENAERAVQLDSKLTVAHAKLGALYGYSGRPDDAIRELRQALQLDPSSAEAYRDLAKVYTTVGRYGEAETAYLEAIRHRPTDWYGNLLLGIFYRQRGRYSEAEEAYRRARTLTPGNEVVYRNLAALYIHQGRYQEARDQLQASLKIQPVARTYNSLGVACYYEHRFQEAASAFETAIDLDSSFYTFWGNAGNAYRWIPGDRAKAEMAFRRAIELAEKRLEVMPMDYSIRANLAEYRAKLGDAKKALLEIEKIPPVVQATFADRIVLVHELGGHRGQAIAAVRSASADTGVIQQVKNDPELSRLWNDPAFQKMLPELSKTTR